MRVLKFNISGKTAFFRNNNINDGDITFSYGHIHYVALRGLLGAILGLSGHNASYFKNQDENYIHPDFYTKLKDIKCSIVPVKKYQISESNFKYIDAYSFNRKKQTMTNNCGVSKNKDTKEGQNLIYTEQWIEDVSWDIYILLNSLDKDLSEKLVDYIFDNKAVYLPYLGKTNHLATITAPELLDAENVSITDFVVKGLFKTDSIIGDSFSNDIDVQNIIEYREFLPTGYKKSCSLYKSELISISNKCFEFNIDDYMFLKISKYNIILNFN